MMPSHRPLPSFVPRALAALAALVAVVACNASVSNPAQGLKIVGSYKLVSVNGARLPALTDSGYSVVSGSLNLGSNTNYTLNETYSTAGSTSTFSLSGSWTVFASQLTLFGPGSSALFGTFSAQLDTLSVPINGHTSEYVHE